MITHKEGFDLYNLLLYLNSLPLHLLLYPMPCFTLLCSYELPLASLLLQTQGLSLKDKIKVSRSSNLVLMDADVKQKEQSSNKTYPVVQKPLIKPALIHDVRHAV